MQSRLVKQAAAENKNLVHAIIGGKDRDCGSAELSVNLLLTRGHGSLLLELLILLGRRDSERASLGAVLARPLRTHDGWFDIILAGYQVGTLCP
jgi:hypothetical protein